MKNLLLRYSFYLLILSLFDSCQSIMFSIYGIREPQRMSQENIVIKGKRYNINQEDIHIIDFSFFTFLDSINRNAINIPIYDVIQNHCQPLQVMVFDSINRLCSYHTNCYAEGFPNLKWEGFDVFPPTTATPIDTIITFDILKAHISHSQDSIIKNQKNYTVIVFWTTFMGRQSKRLITLMQQKIPKDKAKLIYINIDALFES